MARWICTKDCRALQKNFRVGDIIDNATNPQTGSFVAYNGDKTELANVLFKRDLDGTVYLNKPQWRDMTFPATGLNPPGLVSDPSRDSDDGLLLFSPIASNMIIGLGHMNHEWRERTEVRPHVHWQATSSGEGQVVLRFDYDVARPNGEFSGTWTQAQVVLDVPGNANLHNLTPLGGIEMSDMVIGTAIKWRLLRLGAAANDTYADDWKLIELDFHFQRDSFGSGREYEK